MDGPQSHAEADAITASRLGGTPLWPDEVEAEVKRLRNVYVVKYGDDPYVRASNDLDRVQELVSEGVPVTAEGVFAAIEDDESPVEVLGALLRSGVSPNIRPKAATDEGVLQGWSSRDVTLYFRQDWHDWHPLKVATCSPTFSRRKIIRQAALVSLLLDFGPNIYAVFRQPLRRSQATPYPGDDYDSELDPGKDLGAYDSDEDDRPPKAPIYGLRSVVHSIFEDGGYVKPFLDESLHLDLESRDPQGRTIVHSACRSALGADAHLDGQMDDIHLEGAPKFSYSHDPFVPIDHQPSLFHTLRLRNADLLAVDDSGRNILHHLLEAEDFVTTDFRPPQSKDAIKYVLEHLQKLVNQPDHYGTYPLHAALQRCRRYKVHGFYTREAGLESVVDDLLAAGANPMAQDGRGNTALHYLAHSGLSEQISGENTRRLFQYFLNCGIDVNKRNRAGRTALEIFLDDNGEIASLRWSAQRHLLNGLPSEEEVNAQVLDWFDEAGASWTSVGLKGQTLLHIVAKQTTDEDVTQVFRVRTLLAKGVDPMVKDEDGQTALDLAKEAEVLDILQAL